MDKRVLGVAALLGSGLVIVWMFAIGYSATSWLTWTVLACAAVALAGIGPASTPELLGVGTWPVAGAVLLSAWLFAMASGATRWLSWLSFAFGLAFVILSVGFTAASSNLGLVHRRHAHGRT